MPNMVTAGYHDNRVVYKIKYENKYNIMMIILLLLLLLFYLFCVITRTTTILQLQLSIESTDATVRQYW